MKTSFELINDGVGVTVLTHETRIHTNRNESRPLRLPHGRLRPRSRLGRRGEEIGQKKRADCEGASVPRLPAISRKRSRE